MKRRIDSLITKNKIKSYDEYIEAIKSDKKMLDDFVTYLTINVSEFYRNPEQWKLLENEILPNLFERFGNNLKIWSAACSTGDEPYTLVMLKRVLRDFQKNISRNILLKSVQKVIRFRMI